MTETPVETRRDRTRVLAAVGGGWGLAAGTLLLLIGEREGPHAVLETMMPALVYLAPFAVGLLAVLLPAGVRRTGLWFGTGIAGILLSMTSLAGVTLIFLPGAVLLIWASAASREAWDRAGTVLGVAALPLVAASVAFWAMLSMAEPACWERRDGGWVRVSDGTPSRLGPSSLAYESVCGEFAIPAGAAVAGGVWVVAGGIPFVRRGAAG